MFPTTHTSVLPINRFSSKASSLQSSTCNQWRRFMKLVCCWTHAPCFLFHITPIWLPFIVRPIKVSLLLLPYLIWLATNLKRPFLDYLAVSPSFFSLSSSVAMYSSAKLSPTALPFLVHWVHWPCLWALIVSFWGLKDARWALDVLKRPSVKPVCEWQITSLAFLWLAKALNKLSMCSTARWIVHWLHSWIWIALKDAARSAHSRMYVCV